ncbi:MAG TPA: hypothetical protein VKY59_03110 [Spirillospora sp.]|nr:hypothetical protein [Spirillospora sp.]
MMNPNLFHQGRIRQQEMLEWAENARQEQAYTASHGPSWSFSGWFRAFAGKLWQAADKPATREATPPRQPAARRP